MRLNEDESKIKTFFHHPLPFVVTTLKTAMVSFPFFFVAWFFNGVLDSSQLLFAYFLIGTVFVLIIGYRGLVYFLDRLIVTNKRIIYVDWKTLFDVGESGAEFNEIQDIETSEHGILSSIPLFDYGTFHVETSATKTSITFYNAIDPEGIKYFIYHLQKKPSRIENGSPLESTTYDRAYEEKSEEAGVGRGGRST